MRKLVLILLASFALVTFICALEQSAPADVLTSGGVLKAGQEQ